MITIPPVPTPVPSSDDPDNFDPRADAVLGALPGIVEAMNTQNEENNQLHTEIHAKVDTAFAAGLEQVPARAQAALQSEQAAGAFAANSAGEANRAKNEADRAMVYAGEAMAGAGVLPSTIGNGGRFLRVLPDESGLEWVSGTPAGAVLHFGRATPPDGWLVADGAAVNRSAYADLYNAIGTVFGAGDGATTFNLPDLRGEFVRGFDGGRGVDTGRAFGSTQGGQNQAHSHTATTDSAGAHTHTMTARDYSPTYGANMMGGNLTTGGNAVVSSSSGAHTHNLTVQSSGGSEARPRNVALLACIKY